MTVNGLIISNVVIQSEMGSHNLFAELKISQTISLVIDQVMSKLVWFLSLGIRILLKEGVRQPSASLHMASGSRSSDPVKVSQILIKRFVV